MARDGLRGVLVRSPALLRAARYGKALWWRARMRPHDDDFVAFRAMGIDRGTALDIGANLGQSAISLLSVCPGLKVISLEANPSCSGPLHMLASTLAGRMSVVMAGAGAAKGELTFHVPVRNNRSLLEEGTFDLASLTTAASVRRLGRIGVDYTIVNRHLPVVTVDSLGVDPVLMKIDVQGWEHQVLAGARDTLAHYMPVVMLELGDNEPQCEGQLIPLGYTRWFWDGVALVRNRPPDAVNVFFIPR